MPETKLPEIENRFLKLIADKQLPLGAELPSSGELTRELGTNRSLLSKVSHGLITKGILERRGYKLYLAAEPGGEKAKSAFHVYCLTSLPVRSLNTVRQEARLQGFELTVRSLPHWTGWEGHLEMLSQTSALPNCDGVVFHSHSADTPAFLALQQEFAGNDVPIVCAQYGSRRYPGAYTDARSSMEMALKHLAQSGHRRVAVEDAVLRQIYPECKPGVALELNRHFAPDIEELSWFSARSRGGRGLRFILEKAEEAEKPEALVISANSERMVQSLLADVAYRPSVEISVMALGASPSDKGLATIGENATELVCQAYRLLAAYLFNSGNPLANNRLGIVLCPPQLHTGSSLRTDLAGNIPSPTGRVRDFLEIQQALPGKASPWPSARKERIAEARALQRLTYPGLPTDQACFHPVDLAGVFNEPYSRPVQGFGHAPLRYVPTGQVTLQGVPFQVLDDNHGHRAASLIMRSRRRRRSQERDLPRIIRLPINRKAASIFFLHGCAHALRHNHFATYTMVAEDGEMVPLPLVSRGRLSEVEDYSQPQVVIPLTASAKKAGVNIQDWYNDYPQFENDQAKCVLLTGPDGDPYHHQCYLYTLRWENPRPEVGLKEIVVESDPDCLTTLGLFAVTLFSG